MLCFEPGIVKREANPNRFVSDVSPTIRRDMGDNLPCVCTHTTGGTRRHRSRTARPCAPSTLKERATMPWSRFASLKMLFHDEGGCVMNRAETECASTITLNTGKAHAEIVVLS